MSSKLKLRFVFEGENPRNLKFTLGPTGAKPLSVFFGRISAHTLLLTSTSHKGFSSVNAASGRKSAPKKLQSTFQRKMFVGFWSQRTPPC